MVVLHLQDKQRIAFFSKVLRVKNCATKREQVGKNQIKVHM